MEVSDEFGLDEVCLESHAPVKSDIPKACFKDIKDLKFEGMPDDYVNCYMARVKDSQYLMDAGKNCYFVDIGSLTAKKVDIGSGILYLANCFINGEYILIVGFHGEMAILRNLKYIGQIKFHAKIKRCKNGLAIRGRYAQQASQTVYALEYDGRLYRIEWQVIKEGNYQKKQIRSNVENFFVDKELGMAIVDTVGTLYLDNEVEVDITIVNIEAKWTIVTCIAKCWIVSGDHQDQTSMASINKKGEVRWTLKLKMTSNGYKNRDGREYGGIYALRKVYATGMRGIIMAIEGDGCCHLIFVDQSRLSILQSIDSIVPLDVVKGERKRFVISVTATAKRGQFIFGGYNWTRLITVKYKQSYGT